MDANMLVPMNTNLRIMPLLSILAAAVMLEAAELKVLCTTFPIHQIARNVIGGQGRRAPELLLPAALGCPHHYTLAPRDMRRLAQADVLIINGLGMEAFLDAPLKQYHPDLAIIDSSAGIAGLISDSQCRHDAADAAHHHGCVNPHLFASPRMAAHLALNIAAGLAAADPAGAAVYRENARAYAARLNALADEMAVAAGRLSNNRIVQPHGAFDYLARDIGLEIMAVTQPHGLEPSAAEMLALARIIREKQAGVIFMEPQYAFNVGRTLARETGVPAVVMDTAATGPADAPPDYYEQAMRRNITTLQRLAGRPDPGPIDGE